MYLLFKENIEVSTDSIYNKKLLETWRKITHFGGKYSSQMNDEYQMNLISVN